MMPTTIAKAMALLTIAGLMPPPEEPSFPFLQYYRRLRLNSTSTLFLEVCIEFAGMDIGPGDGSC